jgi:CxxC-x17-CxxC domain-containing protein
MAKSPITERRLRDGARAMALPEPGPLTTLQQLQEQIDIAQDGILALQSTDDLGEELNRKVQNDLTELFSRVERWKERLDKDTDDMAKHIAENQIAPQLRAKELGFDVAFVNTNLASKGFEVTCYGCGRKAKLPFEVPAGKAVLCPACIKEKT